MSRPDLSPAAIEARLAEVERLRRGGRRRTPADLSEPAITRRLREVSALLRLCVALGALPVGSSGQGSQASGRPSPSAGSSEPGQAS